MHEFLVKDVIDMVIIAICYHVNLNKAAVCMYRRCPWLNIVGEMLLPQSFRWQPILLKWVGNGLQVLTFQLKLLHSHIGIAYTLIRSSVPNVCTN